MITRELVVRCERRVNEPNEEFSSNTKLMQDENLWKQSHIERESYIENKFHKEK